MVKSTRRNTIPIAEERLINFRVVSEKRHYREGTTSAFPRPLQTPTAVATKWWRVLVTSAEMLAVAKKPSGPDVAGPAVGRTSVFSGEQERAPATVSAIFQRFSSSTAYS